MQERVAGAHMQTKRTKVHPNDPVATRAALLHIEIDIICSRDPEFRKILEFLAKFGKRKKRRRY